MTFHHRYTGGIPGLFPLVLDLPVRFTETPRNGHHCGVFKNTQGRIKGWCLHEEDARYVDKLDCIHEHELVLKKLPLRILVEVASGKETLNTIDGMKIYELEQTRRLWTLDKQHAKIYRFGFPLVPDFGGTVHAYSGSTLEACIGDLLRWSTKATRSEALRAYIMLTLVRDASKLLIAEPFSPNLFRQGVLPGPDLLMKVLTNEWTPKPR